MKKLIFCMMAALIVISCTDYDIDELLAAPEQVDIQGYSFVMSVHLLDYSPFGNSLYATVNISTVDSSTIPLWLDADEMWVIDGDNVWHDELIHGIDYQIPWLMTKHNEHEGPQWNAGIYVDVVVQLIDNSDNTYLIRVSDVFINGC